ncbi:NmrA domain-containing protein [Mycena indigotica]|uniref:NmrA domain-containing protein n=1 Tax=Mycena indigotica TaxID=2126181 RepID=A0A8H6SXA6_9AGAR|nr:NmrA domain-containing protein [Mycena indigotica]KAF7306517.1 NmrA domain-containing protein [Mycena indigotica]
MSYTSFALVGAGTVGYGIVAGLAAKNVPIVVLSRPGSKNLEELPAGAKSEVVDTTDTDAVAAIFKKHKVDVVLATLTTTANKAQYPLIDAAKAAGVKLFVPSEYGMPTEGQTEGILGEKNDVAAYAKKSGIPSLRVFAGGFVEYIPWLFTYTENKKINVVGEGDVAASYNAVADVIGFVVHVLTTLPPAELEDKIFRIEGDRKRPSEIAALLNTTIERVDKMPGELSELRTGLSIAFSSGAGSTGWDAVNKTEGTGDAAAGSANKLWPGHSWQTIKQVHNL